jgi:hypothetical protein
MLVSILGDRLIPRTIVHSALILCPKFGDAFGSRRNILSQVYEDLPSPSVHSAKQPFCLEPTHRLHCLLPTL